MLIDDLIVEHAGKQGHHDCGVKLRALRQIRVEVTDALARERTAKARLKDELAAMAEATAFERDRGNELAAKLADAKAVAADLLAELNSARAKLEQIAELAST